MSYSSLYRARRDQLRHRDPGESPPRRTFSYASNPASLAYVIGEQEGYASGWDLSFRATGMGVPQEGPFQVSNVDSLMRVWDSHFARIQVEPGMLRSEYTFSQFLEAYRLGWKRSFAEAGQRCVILDQALSLEDPEDLSQAPLRQLVPGFNPLHPHHNPDHLPSPCAPDSQ
ncbi:hypothetical protein KIPB_014744, partial [Kipferlia bialata]|eukprot:g14744.t1